MDRKYGHMASNPAAGQLRGMGVIAMDAHALRSLYRHAKIGEHSILKKAYLQESIVLWLGIEYKSLKVNLSVQNIHHDSVISIHVTTFFLTKTNYGSTLVTYP